MLRVARRVARLVMLPCRSTCHVAVSLDLSCCRVARLVMLPCRSTCHVNLSRLLAVLCCRLERVVADSRVSAVSDLALHQVPIEHVIQFLTYVIRRHDYTPSPSER